jgi:hypothetical protein
MRTTSAANVDKEVNISTPYPALYIYRVFQEK